MITPEQLVEMQRAMEEEYRKNQHQKKTDAWAAAERLVKGVQRAHLGDDPRAAVALLDELPFDFEKVVASPPLLFSRFSTADVLDRFAQSCTTITLGGWAGEKSEWQASLIAIPVAHVSGPTDAILPQFVPNSHPYRPSSLLNAVFGSGGSDKLIQPLPWIVRPTEISRVGYLGFRQRMQVLLAAIFTQQDRRQKAAIKSLEANLASHFVRQMPLGDHNIYTNSPHAVKGGLAMAIVLRRPGEPIPELPVLGDDVRRAFPDLWLGKIQGLPEARSELLARLVVGSLRKACGEDPFGEPDGRLLWTDKTDRKTHSHLDFAYESEAGAVVHGQLGSWPLVGVGRSLVAALEDTAKSVIFADDSADFPNPRAAGARSPEEDAPEAVAAEMVAEQIAWGSISFMLDRAFREEGARSVKVMRDRALRDFQGFYTEWAADGDRVPQASTIQAALHSCALKASSEFLEARGEVRLSEGRLLAVAKAWEEAMLAHPVMPIIYHPEGEDWPEGSFIALASEDGNGDRRRPVEEIETDLGIVRLDNQANRIDGDGLRFSRFAAEILGVDGRPISFLSGWTIRLRSKDFPPSEFDFHSDLDEISDSMVSLGGQLLEKFGGDAAEVFEAGDLIWIQRLETRSDMRRKGFGKTLISAACSALKRKYRGLKVVVAAVSAPSLMVMPGPCAPADLRMLYGAETAAFRRLLDDKVWLAGALGTGAEAWVFDETAQMTSQETLLQLGVTTLAMMVSREPGEDLPDPPDIGA